MRKHVLRIGLVMLLAFAGGCGAGVEEIGPAKTTHEMTDEEKAAQKRGMEESLKHMPPEQQRRYREMMKKRSQ